MNWRLPAALLFLSLLLGGYHRLSRGQAQPTRGAEKNSPAASQGGSESPAAQPEAKSKQRITKPPQSGPKGITRLEDKSARNRILGPEDGEMSFEPLSAVTLARGSSLMTGGYVDEKGRFVFTIITPQLAPRETGDPAIMVSSIIFAMDRAQLAESGFDHLIRHRRESDQHADLWSVDDAKETFKSLPSVSVISRPTIFMEAGHKGLITVERENDADLIEATATPKADGGFEMQTGWRRIAKPPPMLPGGGFNGGGR